MKSVFPCLFSSQRLSRGAALLGVGGRGHSSPRLSDKDGPGEAVQRRRAVLHPPELSAMTDSVIAVPGLCQPRAA